MSEGKQLSQAVAGELRRDLRLADAVGIGLGAVIGAGIFVVTGVAAGIAGPAFLIGLLVAGMAAACNGLSSAQLAALYPQSGGTYEYGYRVLHPWLGFSAGWMFLASKLAAGGVVALGFGSYVAALIPGAPTREIAVTAAALLALANIAGIKKTGALNLLVVAITLTTLVAFVVSGLPAFNRSNLEPFAPYGLPGIGQSAALLFFAYTGYARLATLGEEVHDPKVTIPRAIIATLVLSFVLYFAVAFVAVGAIGSAAMAETASPLRTAAEVFPWKGAGILVSIGAATAMVGVLLSQILGISRMMLAMARRRDLPRFLEHINPSRGVPDWGILLTSGVIIVLAMLGTLETVVAAAAFTILLYYTITNIAALRMPREHKLYPNWVPWLGLAACLMMAASLPNRTIIAGLALLGAGLVVRLIVKGRLDA